MKSYLELTNQYSPYNTLQKLTDGCAGYLEIHAIKLLTNCQNKHFLAQ